MTPLTKDEVRNLTPEQQIDIGIAEASRIRARQELLDRARHYRGMHVIAGLLMGAAGGLALISNAVPRLMPFAIIAVVSLVAFHAAGINRRLDALMELLEHDIKTATSPCNEAYPSDSPSDRKTASPNLSSVHNS